NQCQHEQEPRTAAEPRTTALFAVLLHWVSLQIRGGGNNPLRSRMRSNTKLFYSTGHLEAGQRAPMERRVVICPDQHTEWPGLSLRGPRLGMHAGASKTQPRPHYFWSPAMNCRPPRLDISSI